MKWILFSALAFAPTLFSLVQTADDFTSCCCKEDQGPDLFKRNAQVYSAHAEFLYWTITEGCLDYALKMRHSAWSPTTPSYAQGRFENATFDFDPGFRVALSYFRAPHYWESRWQYTRLTCKGDNVSHKPQVDTKYLVGTFPQITTLPLTKAKSHIHFNYNTFDWYVDRVFFPNPHLRLRVLGGATAAWMDQEWKIHYFDSVPNCTTICNRWHYVGGGLKTGSTVDWYWTGDLYMTGVWSFGALIGSYSNHSKQHTTFQPDSSVDTAVPFADTGYHDIRPTFTAQMILGPSWQKNFCKNRVELFAGFEMNFWMNLQEIYRSSASSAFFAKETFINSSTLTLYGVTTRLTVDF